ncbi:Short chain dehydrogenase, partial [Lachnellula hyalina]
ATAAQRPTPTILPVQLDISDRKSTEAAAALVEEEFGRLDIVVLNAAILSGRGVVLDSDPDEWWETMTVNVKGPYLVTRAFLPLLLKGGDKTIVALSSVGAHIVTPGLSAYQVTKLAVLRFMEFVSAEYGGQGVLAFAVHPGNIPTDIIGGPEGLSEELKPSELGCFVNWVRGTGLTVDLVFVETPELSADTIVFLTKEKREWLGGRYVNCTWDMPELMAQEDEIVKGDKLKVRLVF